MIDSARAPLTRVQRAFRPRADDLGARVIRGAGFTFVGIAIRTLLTIGSMAILARLLSPREFGLVAMAGVVTEFAALFASVGFASILIQKPRVSRMDLDTTFWASLGLGVALAMLVFLGSFLVPAFFDEPEVGPLLRLMALMFVLAELPVVPGAIQTRLLRFGDQLLIQIGMLVVRAGSAIACAYLGFGVWSLVIGSLAGSLTEGAMSLAMTGYVPRWRFSWRILKAGLGINGGHFGNGALQFVNANVDVILVGRMLGATPLGYYQNARSLSEEIRARIAFPLQRVLFPALSMLQQDVARCRPAILRSGRLLALLVMPIGFGMAATAEDLVPLLYGSQWTAMIPLVRIVAITSALRVATLSATSLFFAKNRVGLAFRLGIVHSAVHVVAIAVGSQFGIVGVAFATAAAGIYGFEIYRRALALFDLGVSDLFRMTSAPVFAALGMAATVTVLRHLVLPTDIGLLMRLSIHVAAGALAYPLLLRLLSREHVADVMTIVHRVFGERLRSASS